MCGFILLEINISPLYFIYTSKEFQNKRISTILKALIHLGLAILIPGYPWSGWFP